MGRFLAHFCIFALDYRRWRDYGYNLSGNAVDFWGFAGVRSTDTFGDVFVLVDCTP